MKAVPALDRIFRHPPMNAELVNFAKKAVRSIYPISSITPKFFREFGGLSQISLLDSKISDKLMALVGKGSLPFQDRPLPPKPGEIDINLPGLFPTPDTLLLPSWVVANVDDPGIQIEPAWKISLVYGLPCGIYYQIPTAYYLAARFRNDFESAVLHAINGGGQNMSRAFLTGALVGAQVGLSKIPQRFISGLENSKEMVELALALGDLAEVG